MTNIIHRLLVCGLALKDICEPEQAAEWILTPQPLLDGRVPMWLLFSDTGTTEVYAAISRLRDSVHIA